MPNEMKEYLDGKEVLYVFDMWDKAGTITAYIAQRHMDCIEIVNQTKGVGDTLSHIFVSWDELDKAREAWNKKA